MTITRSITSSSNVARRRLCPGSEAMEVGRPNVESPYSKEGTLLHDLDACPEKDRSEITESQRVILERNAEMRNEFISGKLDELGIPRDARVKIFKDGNEFFLCDEQGVPLDPPFPGHPDIIYYYPDYRVAIIWDSKFGRVPVTPAECNDQLRSYTVMFAEHFECDQVIVAIGQPWLKAPQSLHAAKYQGEHIPLFKAEMLSMLRAARQKGAKRFASPEACRFCLGRAICPEAVKNVEILSTISVEALTPDQLEALEPVVKIAEGVIEARKAQLKLLAAGDKLKIFTLSKESFNREVKDIKAARSAVVESAKLLTNDDFDKATEVSVSKLQALIAKAKGVSEKKAKPLIEEALGELITFKPREKSLKKREEVD
jgi:hypothetical protein